MGLMSQNQSYFNGFVPQCAPRCAVRRSVSSRGSAGSPGRLLSGAKKRYPKFMKSSSAVGSRGAVPVLRHEIGEVLRDLRQNRGQTLRAVSAKARVSLGYLSEIERGQKEASSELLASICYALNVPVSFVLREVADRVALQEGVFIPESLPESVAHGLVEDLTPAI